MIFYLPSIVIGFYLIMRSSDEFVVGACHLAKYLKLSPVAIGVIIVGFGTSAPEMIISLLSSLAGNPGIAVGNAYGSNIANIGLVLGVTAIVRAVPIHTDVLFKQFPALFLVMLLAFGLSQKQTLNSVDGMIFIGALGLYLSWTFWCARSESIEEPTPESSNEVPPFPVAVAQTLIGLAVLLASAKLMVWGAENAARSFGISDLIIGLSIVAIGTSLPELAASYAAAKHGETDLIIGNIIGSNVFNTLGVVGISTFVSPIELSPEVMERDWLFMGILTGLLVMLQFRKGQISRLGGSVLLASYGVYIWMLFG